MYVKCCTILKQGKSNKYITDFTVGKSQFSLDICATVLSAFEDTGTISLVPNSVTIFFFLFSSAGRRETIRITEYLTFIDIKCQLERATDGAPSQIPTLKFLTPAPTSLTSGA